MAAQLSLFEGYYDTYLSIPDKYVNNENIFKIPSDNFVISRDNYGKTLSTYGDIEWDFSPYTSESLEGTIFKFNKFSNNSIILKEIKWIMFLLIVFAEGRGGTGYSVQTLRNYFRASLTPLFEYATIEALTLNELLSSANQIKKYIARYCTNNQRVRTLSSLLSFLTRMNNKITGINYFENSEINNILIKLSLVLRAKHNQTAIIPSKILSESIKQRWEQINDIESNLDNLLNFIKEYLSSEYFAIPPASFATHKRSNNKKAIVWDDALKKFELADYFKRYSVKNRSSFQGFVKNIQGTCKHLLHAYSGMRNGEVLSMKINCLEMVKDRDTLRLIGTTTKLESGKKQAKWVTTDEISRVINILSKINKVIATHYHIDFKEMPLFLTTSLLVANKKDINMSRLHIKKFSQEHHLPMNESKLTINENDMIELEDIDKIRPEIEALSYIKNVIFSDEQLFGTHGTFLERNTKIQKNKKLYLLEDREKTIKQFKEGSISYKETAIGGCISTEACDFMLTRSIVACSSCDSSIIKKSKLDNLILKQKRFIEYLDKESPDYRTEIADLKILEDQRKLFLGSKA